MSRDSQLSDLQLAIMRVLWQRGEAPVATVHEDLAPERGLAVTTVATVLSRLEKRGLVRHRTEGRQFVFRPSISEQEVRRSMVADLTDRLFAGDATALMSHLLTSREIEPGDLEMVKALLKKLEDETEESDAD
jgi:predicted transcriptional regulator